MLKVLSVTYLVAIGRRQEQEQPIHNLGYVFHPGYAGQGYATESCRAAMGYLFDQLAAEGILTGTHPGNQPSVAPKPFSTELELDSSLLSRSTAVVRDRGDVFNQLHIQASRLQ